MLGCNRRHDWRATARTFSASGDLSGAWFDPRRSGEGYTVDISSEAVVVAWFTFDGAGEPVWLICQAPMPEDGIQAGIPAALDIRRFRGGSFAHPITADGSVIGTATVEWSSCNQGRLSFDLEAPFGSGAFDMRRIVADGVQGVECICPVSGVLERPHADSLPGLYVRCISWALDPLRTDGDDTEAAMEEGGPILAESVRRLARVSGQWSPRGYFISWAGISASHRNPCGGVLAERFTEYSARCHGGA